MFNKIINQFKELDKKKSDEETNDYLMSVDDFFNRTGFEIEPDTVWKMTASQLEKCVGF